MPKMRGNISQMMREKEKNVRRMETPAMPSAGKGRKMGKTDAEAGKNWMTMRKKRLSSHALLAQKPAGADILPVPMKGSGRMHISLGRMVGLPVMVHSRQIGYVENAMLDAQRVRLAGLVIRRGIGAAKWADCKAILRLETRSVLLDSPPVRMAGRAQPEPGQVFLATGAYAGEVTDAFLDVRSLCVSALEVCQGPLYRLAGRRAYAAQFCPQGGGNVVAQELLSWAQLVKQLGEEDDG